MFCVRNGKLNWLRMSDNQVLNVTSVKELRNIVWSQHVGILRWSLPVVFCALCWVQRKFRVKDVREADMNAAGWMPRRRLHLTLVSMNGCANARCSQHETATSRDLLLPARVGSHAIESNHIASRTQHSSQVLRTWPVWNNLPFAVQLVETWQIGTHLYEKNPAFVLDVLVSWFIRKSWWNPGDLRWRIKTCRWCTFESEEWKKSSTAIFLLYCVLSSCFGNLLWLPCCQDWCPKLPIHIGIQNRISHGTRPCFLKLFPSPVLPPKFQICHWCLFY